MSNLKTHIENFSKLLKNNIILIDIGCGTKPYNSLFNTTINYIGIEAFSSGRTDKNKTADLYFDGINLPLEDNSVDAILCTQVLEHASHVKDLIQEIQRVMKPGATGLITVPFIWGEHEPPYDFRRFTSFGIKKFILDNNLQVIQYDKCCSGIEAIQTLIFSEFNNFKDNIRICNTKFETLKFQIIDKFCHKAILLLMKVLNRFYKFDRIYIDNVVLFKK